MLTKLMKHELRATSRLLIPLYLVLLFLSITNRFVINMKDYNEIVTVVKGFLVFAYAASIFAVLVVTVFYMIIRFYKNLLTDEGYLMFTLPAKEHELILSKLLITLLWCIISIASILISLFIVFATRETLPHAINIFKEALLNLNAQFGSSWVLPFSEIVILSLLSLVLNILIVYASIAAGQLFSKHKIIGSFVSYVIIYTAIQFLMIMLIAFLGIFFKNSLDGIVTRPELLLPIVIVVLALSCTGFFFGTNYIFKRKLNLD